MHNIENMDFAAYYNSNENKQKVIPASAYCDEVIDRFLGKKEAYPCLPFLKIGDRFQFRPGEVTVWAGYTGHGKSMMTSQVATYLMMQKQKVCLASFEMLPATTIARMVRQAWGTDRPTESAIKQYMEFTNGRGWIYDQQGMVSKDSVFGAIKYSAEQLGVTHFFIDNLMKCVKGEDDYNGQKDFVDSVTVLARDLGIHIHIVHHLRKGESDEKVPARADVKGASSIIDQVDNLLIVWRNKKKERNQDTADDETPDALLICDKQRNGEWEGKAGFWYNIAAQSFCENKNRHIIPFVRY
jgi:twinkle protein